MGDESCHSCMIYKQGDCIGQGLCELYRPIPTSGAKDFWPKTMRSRSNYAGNINYNYGSSKQSATTKNNNSSKESKPVKKSQADWKKKDYVKELNITRKHIENPGSADALLCFLFGQVIAWISYDEVQVASGIKYTPKCMLQLKDHILKVDCYGSEKDLIRAMFRGMIEVANHITKPCTVNYVIDRTMLDGIKVSTAERNDDLLCKIMTILDKKKCHITEIVIKEGTDLIKKQIENPITSVVNSTSNANIVIIEEESEAQQDIPDDEIEHKEIDSTEISQELVEKLEKSMNSGKDNTESKEIGGHQKVVKREKATKDVDDIDGIRIRCRVCNSIFVMSPSEVEFYKKKGFQMPRRCSECRERNIRYSDADYYERGLKHNSYQESLHMYGPRINVNGGLEASPGYVLKEDKNGKSTYERNFGGRKDVIKKRHL